MVHARVADDDRLVDPLRQHAGRAAHLGHVLVQQADDPRVELAEVDRVELSERDARHEIAAEDRLGIQARHRRELLARLQLDQGGDHAGGADVDGEAEFHGRRVAALDRDDRPPGAGGRAARGAARSEGRDGDAGRIVAQRLRQPHQHARPNALGRHTDRRRELLEVGGLVVLLARQRDLHQLLGDAGLDAHAEPADARTGAEDLERSLLERRGHLDGDRLGDRALTGKPIALAHEVVAELDLVHDRGRRDRALDELHAAGRAAAAAAAGGGDIHPPVVRRLEDAGAGRDGQLAACPGVARVRQDDERDGHPAILYALAARYRVISNSTRPVPSPSTAGGAVWAARRPASTSRAASASRTASTRRWASAACAAAPGAKVTGFTLSASMRESSVKKSLPMVVKGSATSFTAAPRSALQIASPRSNCGDDSRPCTGSESSTWPWRSLRSETKVSSGSPIGHLGGFAQQSRGLTTSSPSAPTSLVASSSSPSMR